MAVLWIMPVVLHWIQGAIQEVMLEEDVDKMEGALHIMYNNTKPKKEKR